jgi:hypothetical protein
MWAVSICKLSLENEKYVLVFNEKTGEFYCERYGKRWRDLTGDKMIFSLFALAFTHVKEKKYTERGP